MHQDFTWAEVGKRIRGWREERGLSQHELAAAAGISQPGLLALERGSTNPQLRTLQGVAGALARSVRELMTGTIAMGVEDRSVAARLQRILRSRDQQAIAVVENGISTAELLLDRRRLSRLPRIKVPLSKQKIAALTKRASEREFKVRPRGLRATTVGKGGTGRGV